MVKIHDFTGRGLPLGEAFGTGGRAKRFFLRWKQPWLWQFVISCLIFVSLLGVFSLHSPFAADLQDGFRWYLGDEHSDWTPVLEAMVKNGLWMDSYDRQVFDYNSRQQATQVTTEVTVPTIPVSGQVIVGFGKYNLPVEGGKTIEHHGIDIASGLSQPVKAVLQGKVSKVGVEAGLGRVVQLEHQAGVQTLYGNLSEILVSVGQTVKQGEVLAKVGQGGEVGQPHLHLEVLKDGERLDPAVFFQSPGNI